MTTLKEDRIRAGLYRINGWHVEKRGSYWGLYLHPSDAPRFAAKTLTEARLWISRLPEAEAAA